MIESFADDQGIVLRRDVVSALGNDNLVTRAVRAKQIVRIRQGAYCLPSIWAAADRATRHRLLTQAVLRQYDDAVVLSHVSALLALGGPNWGLPLDHVHLTSLAGIGERTQAGVVHHRGSLRVGDLRRDDRGWITTPARTALDTASLVPRDPAVCVLDWVQQQGLATREELDQGVRGMQSWPDTLALQHNVTISCGRCESVGETRLHLLCRDQHLPDPLPQFDVTFPGGRVAGRVDFAWPDQKAMMEFDGKMKYLAMRREGETIQQCVMREKTREDLLRRLTGWTMIRVVWADLARPRATARMIREFLQLNAA